jgi:hypothetical protein
VGLFPREQCLRAQQQRAFGELRIGSGTGRQGLCGSRARSAWASSYESSACGRSSFARSGSYAAAPIASALAAPQRKALNTGLFSWEQCLRAQQQRAFGELHVDGGTGRHGLCGSRAHARRAFSHEGNACARSSGARLGTLSRRRRLSRPRLLSSALGSGSFSREKCLRTQQWGAFGELHS